jgi:hypothetical protein
MANPVITASAPSGVTTDNTPEVGYTVQNAVPDSVICAVDPVVPIVVPVFEGFDTCPASPYSLPALADGHHDFFVVARDSANNYDYALKSFTVDANGPAVTITGLTEGEVLMSAWPPVAVSSTDLGTGVLSTHCWYDATAPTLCRDSNFLNAPLPEGAHTLNVVSADFAGNVTSRAIHFTVDSFARLRQGVVAPKKATFKARRGKLKRGKYPTTFSVSFELPPGTPTTACSGSAKITVVVRKKLIRSAGAKFKLTGTDCVASATSKLSKKYKKKKATIGLTYKSGPIKAFTLYGTSKL